MFARLRQPGGPIGAQSLAAALILGVLGVLGVAAMLVAWATGSGFWTDDPGDQLFTAFFFAAMALGAYGFWIMDREPLQGTILAVVGSLAFAVILFWAILPLILGPLFAVTAVIRARLLDAPRPPLDGTAV